MAHPHVLGLDPAIKNFGFSVIQVREDFSKYRLRTVGNLSFPINQIEGRQLQDAMNDYLFELDSIFSMYNPSHLVVERFMNRSLVGASMTEKVNIMIGLAALHSQKYRCKLTLVSAGAWKNRVNPHFNLKKSYNIARKHVREYCKLDGHNAAFSKFCQNQVPHCIDSSVMAIVYGSESLGFEQPIKLLDYSLCDEVAQNIVQKQAKKIKRK